MGQDREQKVTSAPSAATASPRHGSIIGGRYRLEQKIGEGGSGSIWRAIHMDLEKPVAIKFLHRVDAALNERFLREAKTAASMRHRHVVQLTDFGVEQGTPYMVMELLEGQSLAERMEAREPISLSETVRIGSEILLGLSAVHDNGLVHRDLKPENAFIVRDAEGDYVKLVDFGLSKNTGEGESVYLTRDNALAGTPHYMSPEQARADHDLDHRTDLFSTGVVLFEMLCAATPFDGDDLVSILSAITSAPTPPVSSFFRKLGPAMDAFFQRALHKDRARRFQSARQMREALFEAAADSLREWPHEEVSEVQRLRRVVRKHASSVVVARLESEAESTPTKRRDLSATDNMHYDSVTAVGAVKPVMRKRSWRFALAISMGLIVTAALIAFFMQASSSVAPDSARASRQVAPLPPVPQEEELPPASNTLAPSQASSSVDITIHRVPRSSVILVDGKRVPTNALRRIGDSGSVRVRLPERDTKYSFVLRDRRSGHRKVFLFDAPGAGKHDFTATFRSERWVGSRPKPHKKTNDNGLLRDSDI